MPCKYEFRIDNLWFGCRKNYPFANGKYDKHVPECHKIQTNKCYEEKEIEDEDH